jgi:chromosome segregation ATPase
MNFAVLPPEAPAATDAIYQLLAVLADRAKAKAALAKVVAARNEAQACRREARRSPDRARRLAEAASRIRAWTAAEREKIREAHRQVDASRAEFNVERAVHATKVEALRADREQLERSRSAHE